MEPQLSCLHRTKGTNNHIKQGDTCFFACNPIGVPYNQLAAMLTILFHKFSPDSMIYQRKISHIRFDSLMYRFFGEFHEWTRFFLVCEKSIYKRSSFVVEEANV